MKSEKWAASIKIKDARPGRGMVYLHACLCLSTFITTGLTNSKTAAHLNPKRMVAFIPCFSDKKLTFVPLNRGCVVFLKTKTYVIGATPELVQR